MGWIIILLMALAAVAALWRFGRLERGPLQFLLSAILLALAGYAWQGAPDFTGRPKSQASKASLPPTPFATLRRGIFGGFDRADHWLVMAESYQREGNTADGARIIRSAIRAHPRNATLWTGYGNALVLHGGALNPAADLAFRRALNLAPKHPGPSLFYGMALFGSGRYAEAEQAWRKSLSLSPPDAEWRPGLEQQLRLIEAARLAGQIR
jgi:cytochrome c-type biogenesis protein CcmH/NrfG